MRDFYQWLEENYDLNSFSQSILENPKEATGWLVAADFAEENDDPDTGSLLRSIGTLCQEGMTEAVAEKISTLSNTANAPAGRREVIKKCRESIPWFTKWETNKDTKIFCPFIRHGIIPDEIKKFMPKGREFRCRWETWFSIQTETIQLNTCYYAEWADHLLDFAVIIPMNSETRNINYTIELDIQNNPHMRQVVHDIIDWQFGMSFANYLGI